MQLSPRFTLERFTFSSTAQRLGIDNTPSGEVLGNLSVLASYLERVQDALGCELHFNDVYRCPALNEEVGGSATSDHMNGLAADFTAPAFGDPRDVILKILSAGIPFDQLIYEGSWVHAGFGTRMRGMVLTAHFADGKATYTEGVA